MRRIGYVFEWIISIDNLRKAHFDAKKGKKVSRRRRAEAFEEHLEENLRLLHNKLRDGLWHMHRYINRHRRERGKMRDIWYSPSHEDSIVQHAILRVLGPMINKKLIRQTYASIKGRGTHDCVRRLTRFFMSVSDNVPVWILKADIRHFYDNIQHDEMHKAIDRFVKEQMTASLLHGIIDSFPKGIPIGNALSPMFANMLLSTMDHATKEKVKSPVYHRYLDDMVIIAVGNVKTFMRSMKDWLIASIENLGMKMKDNIQIFPVERHGLDFLGYVFNRHKVTLRKKTERRMRRCAERYNRGVPNALAALGSYWGITKWLSRGRQLWNALLPADIHTLHKWAKLEAITV